MKRPSWDEYFTSVAGVVASRATCNRLAVGCVIVRDKRILATGYNGSLPGAPHCIDSECTVVDGHCINTVHAELNAILQAAKYGTSLQFTVAYVTHNPCLNCYKSLVSVGVRRIVYKELYREVNYSMVNLNANVAPSVVKLNTEEGDSLLENR